MDTEEPTAPRAATGRVNQKLRTRAAILRTAVELICTGRDVTMLEVAKSALVSEATVYRHFPDLASLLLEATAGQMPTTAEALSSVADSADPVERVAAATEHLLRLVLTYQGAARAMIAATITRPESAGTRPGRRFELIDHALAPLEYLLATDPAAVTRLKHDLAVVVSAEALFTLTDLWRLGPEEAIASVVRAATTLTRAALSPER